MVNAQLPPPEPDLPEILVVGAEQVGKSTLVRSLISSPDGTHASPPVWHIRTKYYTARAALRAARIDAADSSTAAVPEAILMVIDATRESTFLSLRPWVGSPAGDRAAVVLLVANKMDAVREERPDWLDAAAEWAGREMVEYVEVSAGDGEIDAGLERWGEGQGMDRVRSALQAHMWPGMEMAPRQGLAPIGGEGGSGIGGEGEGDALEEFERMLREDAEEGEGEGERARGEPLGRGHVEGEEALDAFERLLEEGLSGMRERIAQLPDAERRDAAAKVALRLAEMLDDDSDGA
ncbi:unnamed protein product [Ostreobium quekettii]|uniref:P-loop containing nucleoside triphosphate hydrolase protein n=1 Tax=Ostreobium quekettii TaxID=121088 RepID=A0A8S1J025_9CHLO|nr:unnamed protein product [Ostreobium quekettii]